MPAVVLTRPEFGFIVATRGMLGVGIGLLVAAKLANAPRRAVGWALVAIGAATTIPAAMAVFGGRRELPEPSARPHSHAEL
jgi:hypothetical protein